MRYISSQSYGSSGIMFTENSNKSNEFLAFSIPTCRALSSRMTRLASSSSTMLYVCLRLYSSYRDCSLTTWSDYSAISFTFFVSSSSKVRPLKSFFCSWTSRSFSSTYSSFSVICYSFSTTCLSFDSSFSIITDSSRLSSWIFDYSNSAFFLVSSSSEEDSSSDDDSRLLFLDGAGARAGYFFSSSPLEDSSDPDDESTYLVGCFGCGFLAGGAFISSSDELSSSLDDSYYFLGGYYFFAVTGYAACFFPTAFCWVGLAGGLAAGGFLPAGTLDGRGLTISSLSELSSLLDSTRGGGCGFLVCFFA